jgi:hypothetical protein
VFGNASSNGKVDQNEPPKLIFGAKPMFGNLNPAASPF